MAIYHCSTKTVNRSSAVASVAYRAGEKLEDELTGLTHDFTKKEGVMYTEIISNLDIEICRSELWNMAEKLENRKGARTVREWVIALPYELDADLAIHAPSRNGNDKNHHAHYSKSQVRYRQ